MKYIVMECHPAFAVVLDEQGRFLKVANFRYQVGQTVTDVVQMQTPGTDELHMWKKRRRWPLVVLTLAVTLVLLGGLVWKTTFTTYASVYLRINPEVRLDVNRWEQVLQVTGMNADGRQLLEGFQPEGSLEEVLEAITDRAGDEGYLRDGGKVALALDSRNYDWVVSHGEALRAALAEHLDDGIRVVLGPDWPDQPDQPDQPADDPPLPVPEDDDDDDDDIDDDEDDDDDDEDDDNLEDDEDDDDDECGVEHHHGPHCRDD